MKTIPIKITINGPITMEAEIPEDAVSLLLQLLGKPGSVTTTSETSASTTAPADFNKNWDHLPTAKADVKRLYREVANVGREILYYIASHAIEGCTFDEMKVALVNEGDIQRRMNTIFQVARRLRYTNEHNKGIPPWRTEYIKNKPRYTMNGELADVIRNLHDGGVVPE